MKSVSYKLKKSQIFQFFSCRFFFSLIFILILTQGKSQTIDSLPQVDALKKLSLEELMNVEIEVTSVSKRPEKLTEAASAIQVITQEDIRSSGATNVPEAL